MIYETLEEEVVPLYYDRKDSAYSSEWVRRSKRAMSTVIPRFNMERMLFDYTRGLYRPAAKQYRKLAADGYAGARQLADWKQRVHWAWPKVSLRLLADTSARPAARRHLASASGGGIERSARRRTCESSSWPAGAVASRPAALRRLVMTVRSWGAGWSLACLVQSGRRRAEDGARRILRSMSEPKECGQFATEVRIYPWHELLSHPHELGLMKWL